MEGPIVVITNRRHMLQTALLPSGAFPGRSVAYRLNAGQGGGLPAVPV